MRVIIYVEGPSDKYAMQTLLKPLIDEKRQHGINIMFFETPDGDRKKSVLTKVPIKAANIILNDPHAIVIALPDLYPKNKGFPHETVSQLKEGLFERFLKALKNKGVQNNKRIESRFKVFCFKYDLEALILASEDPLKRRLKIKNIVRSWVVPVENQDHEKPPKKIVESLFSANNMRYQDTVDAPIILSGTNYQYLAEKCPQCFAPFIDYLLSL